MIMSFKVFGVDVEDFQHLLDIVTEELTSDDTYVDEDTGKLYRIDDIYDLYEFCCDSVEGNYNEFEQMFDEMGNHFDGLFIDSSDPYEDARRFYNSTRF